MSFWISVSVTGPGYLAILYFTEEGKNLLLQFSLDLIEHVGEDYEVNTICCLLLGTNLPSVIEQDGEKHTTEKILSSVPALTKQFDTYFVNGAWVYIFVK